VVHDIDLPTDSPGPSQGPGQQPGTGGEHPAPGRTAASGRAWLGWFAAFLLIGAGWALVTPLNQAPDELDHVYRAAAVVRGEVFPHIGPYIYGTGAITNVPTGLRQAVISGPCTQLLGPGGCSFASAPRGQVTVVTGEGRMFPFYYALAGWPSLLFPDRAGWYAMRLDNAVLCALILATAAVVVMSLPRRPLVLAAAMLVGLVPGALAVTGAVNSSGLEVSAALCYWAVLLALIHDNSALSRRLLVWLGVAAAVVLSLTREYDWLWAAMVMVLALATAGREQQRSFLRSGVARAMLLVLAASAAVTEIWSVSFKAYQVYPMQSLPLSLAGAARSSLAGTPKMLAETLGDLAVLPPAFADVCWVVAVAAVVVIGFASSRRAGLLVVAGAALVFAIPYVIGVAGYLHPSVGWWEGRYTLPLAIGVPLLAVARGRPGRPERRVVILLAMVILVAVLCGQAAVYWHAWATWQARPIMHPPYLDTALGTGLLALGALGVLASIGWAEYRALATSAGTHG
jgi:hypothetical protein